MFASLRIRTAFVVALTLCILPAAASAATVTLAWNANTETNIGGYILVYGTSPGSYSGSVDVGNTTSRAVSSLTSGTRYYFAVRAYNTSGVSGPLSSEVNEVASDTPPPPPPTVLLVAAYSFGEASGAIANDKTSNNNDGTLTAGVTRTAAGRFGGGLVFNGVDGMVNIPSSASLDLTSAFTLEAWISPSISGDWRTVLMKNTPTGHTYVLYSDSGATGPSAHAQTTSDRTATAAAPLPLNTWVHVAAVSDGTILRLLVNGQPAASLSLVSAVVSSADPVTIGGNLVWGELFGGTIDEVRIYRGALSDAQVQQDMVTPIDTAETTLPTVSITSPANGAAITGSVNLTATAADNVGVAGVRFALDDANIGAEDVTAPYSLTWNSSTVGNGAHTVTAIARDTSGNLKTSAAVSITVFNDSVLPTVSISSPAGGASIADTVTVTATAADNVAIAGVRFALDGSNIGAEDLTAPYALSWNSTTVPNGSHSLTAIARDTSGNLRTSAAVSVTVSNDSVSPTVSITSPAGGASISGPVTVAATAADNVAIAGVRFALDGSNIGAEDLTAPYALSWNSTTVTNGSHTLTAIARDTSGNLQTSAAVSITVSNDSVLPTVSISSPAGGSSIAGPVTVTATAADNVAIAGVRFALDGSNIGAEDVTAPYALAWDFSSVANGAHTLTAVARDTSGNLQTSAAVSVTVSNSVPPPPPPPVLVAAYGFGETSGTSALDKTSNNNDGTLAGGVVRTAAGRFGKALVFDGIDGIVTIPPAASLDLTSAFTLEAWVSPSISDDFRTVLMKETATGHTFALYSVSGVTGPTAHAQTSSDHTATAAAPLPLNTWTHLAAVSDGTTLRLLVNGLQAASVPLLSAVVTSTEPLRIGGNLVWFEFFAGTIDEVRVYSGALTDAQVQQDMITPVDPADTTLPTVSISSPAAGASITGAVTLTATAADNVAVAGVRFELDGSSIGAEDLTSPYSLVWNSGTVSNGSHSLTAIARDTSGNLRTSAVVSVTVANDSVAPTVSITSPASGASIAGTVTLTATASDAVGVGGVRFALDGSNIGAEDVTAPYSLAWDFSSVATGAHTLTAVARDTSGNLQTSAPVSVTVNNDTVPPTVVSATPAAGATTVAVTANVTATFSEAISTATLSTATFVLRDAANAVVPAAVTYNATTRVATLNPSASLTPATTYTATITGGGAGVQDLAGNPLATNFVRSFTTVQTDTTPPTVTAVTPADGATGVTATSVTVTFSEPMAAASITTVNFDLRNAAGVGVASAVTYNSATRMATLTPSAPLSPDATYTATVKGGAGGVRDVAGNVATGTTVWSFSVGTPDNAPPTVLAVSPGDGATGVPQATPVTATFSEPMAAASITTASFELRNATGAVVPSVVTYDAATQSATLTPSVPLSTGGPYGATVKGGAQGVRDLAGNTPLGSLTWSFSVGTADSTAPTIVAVSPGDGASGVLPSTSVTATFSEPMAAGSITTATVELRNPAGSVVPSAVTYNAAAKSATLTPSAPLTPGATYGVTVRGGAGGVSDLAGNVAAGNTVWSFSVETQVSSNGPVAAYGFDEGTGSVLNDLSGNQLHGTVLGATWQSGRFGRSLEFSGTGNWVTIPANSLLNFGAAVTIEAWVFPTLLDDWRTVVFKETPTGHTYALYAIGGVTGAGGHVQVALDKTAHHTTQLPLGQWSHLTTTYDGQSIRMFVNAVQVAITPASGPVVVSDGELRIGGNGVWGEHFHGRIDEVRLYDRALAPAEIAADMGTPVGGWLAAAYGFNEAAGSTAADASGHRLDGSVTGATWTTGRFGNGLAFNGASSAVTVPHNEWLDLTTGMTLEAWVYPTTGGGWRTVMLKETAEGHTFALYSDGKSGPGAHVQAAADVISEGIVPLPLETWTHLAVTYNGTRLRLFTNGVLTANLPVTGVPVTSTLPLRIGSNSIWGEHFAGVIDEVRIYYRALTAAEITADMNTPVR